MSFSLEFNFPRFFLEANKSEPQCFPCKKCKKWKPRVSPTKALKNQSTMDYQATSSSLGSFAAVKLNISVVFVWKKLHKKASTSKTNKPLSIAHTSCVQMELSRRFMVNSSVQERMLFLFFVTMLNALICLALRPTKRELFGNIKENLSHKSCEILNILRFS